MSYMMAVKADKQSIKKWQDNRAKKIRQDRKGLNKAQRMVLNIFLVASVIGVALLIERI